MGFYHAGLTVNMAEHSPEPDSFGQIERLFGQLWTNEKDLKKLRPQLHKGKSE